MKMKITKRQLKRIIAEEKAKLQKENLEQYQAGYHGSRGEDVQVSRSRLEDAVYEIMGFYRDVEGFSDDEASALVIDEVKSILGL